MRADAGVPVFEFGQKLMAQAVAGVGGVAVGRVFAPGLIEMVKISLDLVARGGEDGAEDAAFGEVHDWMDTGEAFGPCSPDELAEDGFGLVVEGVGSGYCVEWNSGHELAKPGVAEAAGGCFDGFCCFAGFWMRFGLGGCIDVVGVERDTEGLGELGGEFAISIGLIAAQAVMEMGSMEDDAQFTGASSEGAQQGS